MSKETNIFENSYTKLYDKVYELQTPKEYIYYENVDGEDVFISFEDESFRPKANTWYRTDLNTWFKTGSDVSVVNAPVSSGVQTTGYTSHCSK
jgi:hypothetical protein